MTNDVENSPRRRDSELVGDRVRIFRRGDQWYATFQFEGRQHRQSLRTRNKKVARRRAVRLDAGLLDGQVAGAGRVPTVAALVEKYRTYLKNEGRSRKTLQKYKYVLERVRALAERRNVTRATGIDLSLIDAYKAERVAASAAKKTIHTEITIIRQLINFAVERKMLFVDPLTRLKLKKPKPRRQPCWTGEQLEQILTACSEPYKSMLVALSETGMRVGELKYLAWDDVDLERRVIQIRAKEGWRPKTGDERSVPISTTLHRLLSGLPQTGAWVFTAPPSPTYPGGDHQLSERRLLEHLKRVLKRLGLPGHVHTFRHTFISLALCDGTPEAVVRAWVGHVDPQVIRLYTHVHDEISAAAMERLEKARQTLSRPKGQE